MDENQEVVTDETSEVEADTTEQVDVEDLKKKAAIAENYKIRAEKAEREKKALEARISTAKTAKSLEVEDFIDISASLEGLDQREKEYLAKQHKLSGRPLTEIRKDEDFALWQGAYRSKVEKEQLSLTPTSTQPDSDAPLTLAEALASAKTISEKEELLRNAGLYSERKPRVDQVIRRV